MGEQKKKRMAYVTIRGAKKEVTWFCLKSDSNLVFSTSQNGKQRIIYYSSNSFTDQDNR